MSELVIGVFVGGSARRMGGFPKGLLAVPGEGRSIAEHLLALGDALGAECVLVGSAAAYASTGRKALPDATEGAGPLGGLVSLLMHAGTRRAVALACDIPHVTLAVLRRLVAHPSAAPIVAPRSLLGPQGAPFWEPLFARYDAPRVLPTARARLARGVLSLQPLLDELGAAELTLGTDERLALRDWDRPEDVA
jgi:molybdopterin-guanine dinucleotide biosynthesis protein A